MQKHIYVAYANTEVFLLSDKRVQNNILFMDSFQENLHCWLLGPFICPFNIYVYVSNQNCKKVDLMIQKYCEIF